MLECVVNLSEGRDPDRLAALVEAAGNDLLDVHADPHHHRSVLTLVGERAPRAVAATALALLDIRRHEGEHPRLGVVDVVPFVPLEGSTMEDALGARDRFSAWMAETFDVPCFRYGPERSLPDVRRFAFQDLAPDDGPSRPHPSAGASAVGARGLLVAYNLWLADVDIEAARSLARTVRGPTLRALGLQVGSQVQVSMNLVEPLVTGPRDAYRLVQGRLQSYGGRMERAELVGLLPEGVLGSIPQDEWDHLDLDADRTIEARLGSRPSDPP